MNKKARFLDFDWNDKKNGENGAAIGGGMTKPICDRPYRLK
jgi:hypothetical protein